MIYLAKNTGGSIVKGTLILIVGNVIVKIIGALFKLPLANIIGADGMGLYNASFIVYDIFLVLATAGFPLAVSKMVANSSARGNPAEALKIFKVARNCFVLIGTVFSVIMFLGARMFSQLIGNTRSFYSIVALSPAVLLVSIMSAYRGYYQGTNDMIPTTISQVIEAICRLVVGLSLSWYLKSAGFDPQIVAAGAIVGITLGEFSSTFTLAMLHRYRMRKRKPQRKCPTPARKIISTMFATSTPIGIGIIIISVINMLDNAVVMRRLQQIGYTEMQANTLYGTYNMAFTVFSLPITIVSALQISIFPILSYAYACKNYARVSRTAQASMRIAMIVAMASTALFLSLSTPIINIMYFNQPAAAKIAAPLLTLLAPSAVMMALSMLTSSILQSIDKLIVPARSMIFGGAVCLASNWFLVGNRNLGIYGAPVGIFLCFTITSVLNILSINKSKCVRISMKDLFYKPFLPAAVMALTGTIAFNITEHVFGLLKASAFSILLSLINFVLMLFLNNSIDRSDLLILPYGRKLVRFFEKIHLMRPASGAAR
jgi:stage V sporulation protein B